MSIMDKLTGIFTGNPSANEVNFSELIILATLGRKTGLEPTSFQSIDPNCAFKEVAEDTSETPYKKFAAILEEGINKSAPLSEEQIRGAFDLLKSGHAQRDVADTILGLLKSIPRFPIQVVGDIPNIFRNPTDLPRLPGFDVAAKTVNSIIRPEKGDPEKNRIFRLAILAYARMNGVNIEEDNLLDLSDFLETGSESDFAKLVEGGLETLKDQYGVNDLEEAAVKLHSISQACMDYGET